MGQLITNYRGDMDYRGVPQHVIDEWGECYDAVDHHIKKFENPDHADRADFMKRRIEEFKR